MRKPLLTLTLSLTTLAACGKDEAKQDKPERAPTATETAPLVKEAKPEAKPEPEAKAVAPRDPRIVALFEAGKDCAWNDQGMTECPAAKEIKDLAFNNQGSDELAASCAGALTDESSSVRGLAAMCLQGFNDNTFTPQLGAALDAYEAEKDPNLRRLFAWSFGSGNANEGGVEPRLIALIEKLSGDEDGQLHASYLFQSMFPQYLVGSTKPSKEAGDFALKMAKGSPGPVREKAIEALGLLTDRAAEVCPVLIELTNKETWTTTVTPMTKVGGPCLEDIDAVVGLMAEQLATGNFWATHSQPLRQVLRKASLSKAQLSSLKKASKKNLAANKKSESAKSLDAEIKAYVDPATKAAAE